MKASTPALLALICLLSACPTATTQHADGSPTTTQTVSTQVAGELGQDFQEIAKQLLPSVVSISTQAKSKGSLPDDDIHRGFQGGDSETDGLGSGVIVDAESAYVLTNNHVIENASTIWVGLQNGKRYTAEIVGADPPTDLAVLKINFPSGLLTRRPRLKAAVLGDSSQLKIGEWALAIGSPFGLDSTVTAGIISAKGRAEVGVADFEDFIQTDAAINPGNSGGPLVNIKGELIGINTAIASRTMGFMGIGFAIPVNMAQKVMQELITNGKVTRSQLGIYIGEIDQDLRAALKLSSSQQGILVMNLIPDTPAAEAGFQRYDVITSLNGQAVTNVSPFRNQIALTSPGTEVKIDILRQGKPQQLTAKLREASAVSLSNPVEDALQARLGFALKVIDDELRQSLSLPANLKGLLVSEIEPASNAYKRGLRQGDLVTEINQKPVNSWAEATAALATSKPGDAILLSLIREAQSQIMAFEMPK